MLEARSDWDPVVLAYTGVFQGCPCWKVINSRHGALNPLGFTTGGFAGYLPPGSTTVL